MLAVCAAGGSSSNNVLVAGDGAGDFLGVGESTGDDTLNAGTGGDTLVPGFGVDKLNGGTGDDLFVVVNDLAAVTTTMAAGVTMCSMSRPRLTFPGRRSAACRPFSLRTGLGASR